MKLTIKMEKINIEGLEVAVRSGKDEMFEFNLAKYEEGQTELDFEMELGEIATYFGAMMSTIKSSRREDRPVSNSIDFESDLSPEMQASLKEFDKKHAENKAWMEQQKSEKEEMDNRINELLKPGDKKQEDTSDGNEFA